jgi:nitrogen-specific signal transduction histidine kinase
MPTRFAGWSATSAKTRPGTRRARVDIALTDLGYDVVLTIDDDGRGIPESERERVLRRFVRLNEARSRDDAGSGLGLSIVDEVVRKIACFHHDSVDDHRDVAVPHRQVAGQRGAHSACKPSAPYASRPTAGRMPGAG